jgi:hypothetical protein
VIRLVPDHPSTIFRVRTENIKPSTTYSRCDAHVAWDPAELAHLVVNDRRNHELPTFLHNVLEMTNDQQECAKGEVIAGIGSC